MYDKRIINNLYIRYAESKSNEALTNLIVSCDPLLDTLLATRYSRHFRHHQDIKQEIKLRLWQNLGKRDKERLQSEKYIFNPTIYLYFLCRAYAWKVFIRFKRIYREQEETNFEVLLKQGSETTEIDEDAGMTIL